MDRYCVQVFIEKKRNFSNLNIETWLVLLNFKGGVSLWIHLWYLNTENKVKDLLALNTLYNGSNININQTLTLGPYFFL